MLRRESRTIWDTTFDDWTHIACSGSGHIRQGGGVGQRWVQIRRSRMLDGRQQRLHGRKIKESGKEDRFYCVDTWKAASLKNGRSRISEPARRHVSGLAEANGCRRLQLRCSDSIAER